MADCAESSDLAAEARSILGARQGVYVETADGTVLLAQAAAVAVHPASVSKVPTTLALLRKFGPEHRFVTSFSTQGRIHDQTLEGDLFVQTDADPSLVDENALLVAEQLNKLGIARVTGALRPRGPMIFNWQSDDDGIRMRRALAGLTPPAAWAAVRALDAPQADGDAATLPNPPRIEFETAQAVEAVQSPGSTRSAHFAQPADSALSPGLVQSPGAQAGRPLIIHRSQPLLSLVKSLNDYSNNIFKPLADAAGGAAAVESLARSAVPPEMSGEITLGDGAGTDPRNRLSPRAAVKLLRALERELAKSGRTLTDVLPVAGVDEGTLHNRLNTPDVSGCVVGKTGTYGDYGASALIGAFGTPTRGTVYFAIIDHDVPVPTARHRQDEFVYVLLRRLQATPWKYQRDDRPAIARAEVSSQR